MEIINQGAQYKVFDAGNERVKKVLLTHRESQEVIMSWYTPREAPESELAADYQKTAIDSAKYIRDLLLKYPKLGYTFGNPAFEDGGQYIQDKVQVLGDVLRRSSLSEGESLIDGYISLILLHWQYGISERVFNFTVNNGVDSQGRILLLDFGEVTTDKEKVASRIASKRWLNSYSYKDDLPEQFREYYRRTMETRLSREALDTTWLRSVNSSTSS